MEVNYSVFYSCLSGGTETRHGELDGSTPGILV